jgi:HlyD family secretion protein
MLKNPRVLIGVAIVAALLALAMWPRAIEVELAEVTRGPLVVTLDEEGITRVRDRFVVTAPVAGEIGRLGLDPGDRVTRGQVLARLRPAGSTPLDPRTRAEAEAGLRAAQATVERAEAERDRLAAAAKYAEQQLARAERLLAGGAIAREQVELRQLEAQTAADALRAAEYAVAQARQDVQRIQATLRPPQAGGAGGEVTVTSPVEGVVLRVPQQSARVVVPGEPLLEIGDPRRLEIVADLLSADAVNVEKGAAVIIDRWGGAEPLAARVRRIEPSGFTKFSALGVEEQRVNVIIDFEGPDAAWQTLGDGYRVEVRIVAWHGEDVVKVPTGALFRRGNDWAVFVARDGRAQLQTVTIGHRTSEEAQVLSGLQPGDRVVRFPPDTLEDGQRIQN